MGRRQRLILSVLVGAHCAAALFEGFVDVKVIETIVRAAAAAPAPAPAPAETATALSTSIATASLGDDELGRQACSTAFGVVDKCSSEGFLAATADQASAANCFCCYSSTFLSNQYRRCASSIFYSAPGESEAYTTAAVLYSICSDVGRGICSAPTLPTAPPIVITQSSRARGTPSACLAILDIVFSCGSAIPNPQTADSEQLASCFCYTHGTYTTALETLASSCAPWASSQGGPGDYSFILVLESFCERYPPQTSNLLPTSGFSSGTLPTATSTDVGDWNTLISGSSSASSTPPANSSSTSSSSAFRVTAFTTTITSGLAPPGAAPASLIVWLANAAAFVLSFFFLV